MGWLEQPLCYTQGHPLLLGMGCFIAALHAKDALAQLWLSDARRLVAHLIFLLGAPLVTSECQKRGGTGRESSHRSSILTHLNMPSALETQCWSPVCIPTLLQVPRRSIKQLQFSQNATAVRQAELGPHKKWCKKEITPFGRQAGRHGGPHTEVFKIKNKKILCFCTQVANEKVWSYGCGLDRKQVRLIHSQF